MKSGPPGWIFASFSVEYNLSSMRIWFSGMAATVGLTPTSGPSFEDIVNAMLMSLCDTLSPSDNFRMKAHKYRSPLLRKQKQTCLSSLFLSKKRGSVLSYDP